MRAAVAVEHVLQPAQRGGHARADIVAQRHGAQKLPAADVEPFASRERSGNRSASRMRLRRRMRIVGLVGMRQHPVGERGLDRPAQDVRTGDGRDPVAFVGAGEVDRETAGRQFSEPEIMAASVSRIMCLVFSTTSAGSAAVAAALMKVLSRVMIGLMAGAGVWARAVAAVRSPPAQYSISRRLRFRHQIYPINAYLL